MNSIMVFGGRGEAGGPDIVQRSQRLWNKDCALFLGSVFHLLSRLDRLDPVARRAGSVLCVGLAGPCMRAASLGPPETRAAPCWTCSRPLYCSL